MRRRVENLIFSGDTRAVFLFAAILTGVASILFGLLWLQYVGNPRVFEIGATAMTAVSVFLFGFVAGITVGAMCKSR